MHQGRAFPGSVEAAFSSIRLASSALGLKPAVYATILPSKQSIIGERYTFPSLALISLMSVSHFSFGRSAVKSRSTRLAGAGVVSPRRNYTCVAWARAPRALPPP